MEDFENNKQDKVPNVKLNNRILFALNKKDEETIRLFTKSIDDMMRSWNLGKFPNPKKRF